MCMCNPMFDVAIGSINKSLGFVDKWFKRLFMLSFQYRTQNKYTQAETRSERERGEGERQNKIPMRFFYFAEEHVSSLCTQTVHTNPVQNDKTHTRHIHTIPYSTLSFRCQSQIYSFLTSFYTFSNNSVRYNNDVYDGQRQPPKTKLGKLINLIKGKYEIPFPLPHFGLDDR